MPLDTEELLQVLPRAGAVAIDTFTRIATSVDASHYALLPNAVLYPNDVHEIAAIFRYATKHHEHLTFRSGGTSLSGQSVSDGLLVDTRRNFRDITILNNGAQVRVQPGATVRQVNARLARFGRKLGPDPASEVACTIGGVIANNSSGMACGITQNAYQTLHSAIIVLPNGVIVDTNADDAAHILHSQAPEIWNLITSLIQQISEHPELREQIAAQYKIKNTMGYGLNSLTDFQAVLPAFLHLMVGSEGTLGFIAEATFETVPLYKHATTALLIFNDLKSATDTLPQLVETGPATIELMDALSLKVLQKVPDGARFLVDKDKLPLLIKDHAALIVEYQAGTEVQLQDLNIQATKIFSALPVINEPTLTQDVATRESMWHLRKGLYATVAGARRSGTTALLEDISVPVPQLSDTCTALQKLFLKHSYQDAVIFGHAKDGNIHFMLTEDFTDAVSANRYKAFTEEMVDLVLQAGGSLKAEHGTGRMMAPFVRRQYGEVLYTMMQDIKRIFDPAGILSPGVLVSVDPFAHMKNIKANPKIEDSIDTCVECGYCEPVCPSKDLTTTPRQRIVIRRAIATATHDNNKTLIRELIAAQQYQSIDTCAADGMCATTCPLAINTGDLVKELRQNTATKFQQLLWLGLARNWGLSTGGISKLLTLASLSPAGVISPLNKYARRTFGEDLVPLWTTDLPRGGQPRFKKSLTTSAPENRNLMNLVYFPSCTTSMFASESQSFLSLIKKAGINCVIPESINNLCCGTPFKSKGMALGYKQMQQQTVNALLKASNNGALPIISDHSSCTEGLIQLLGDNGIKVIDAVEYTAVNLLPKLNLHHRLDSIVLHPTCSSTALNTNIHLNTLANAISHKVTIPDDWGCCGFAGDRGMLHPELTKSATARESAAVNSEVFDAYVSCNRTCEIGMSRATGHDYEHILSRLDALAR